MTVDGGCAAYKREDGSVEVQGRRVSETFFDLPRINYSRNGHKYSFAYGVDVSTKGVEFCRVGQRRRKRHVF